MSLRGTVGIVEIERRIGIGTSEIENHADGDVGVADVFHLLNDHFAALVKFLLELGDQRFRALSILLFEGLLRVMRDGKGNQGNRCQNGGKENQKDLIAKTHGCTPGAFRSGGVSVGDAVGSPESSQTSASRHSPEDDAVQFRTVGAMPT
jgi:hypothetical protein